MHLRTTSIVAAALGLVLACGSTTTLEPAESASTKSAQPAAAEASQDGVRVVAESGWPGNVRIQSKVTPLRVTIENRSGGPLEIRYENFKIWDQQNKPFQALRLEDIGGKAMAKAKQDNPVLPRQSRNFTMEPGFATMESGVQFYDDDPEHDGFASHTTSLRNIPLPTQSMYEAALPEGTLADGGRVEGYLYFERIGKDAKKATLKTTFQRGSQDVTDAISLEIPFDVVKR